MVQKHDAYIIADEQLKSAGLEEQYTLDSCEFFVERTGKYASPAEWVVRYMKLSSFDGSVTDDGDELFVVRIEAESGSIQVSRGL